VKFYSRQGIFQLRNAVSPIIETLISQLRNANLSIAFFFIVHFGGTSSRHIYNLLVPTSLISFHTGFTYVSWPVLRFEYCIQRLILPKPISRCFHTGPRLSFRDRNSSLGICILYQYSSQSTLRLREIIGNTKSKIKTHKIKNLTTQSIKTK